MKNYVVWPDPHCGKTIRCYPKAMKTFKRIISFTALALLLCAAAFAQSISEVASVGSETSTTKTFSGPIVDLSKGTSSSDLVSASFNKDGNLEVTYEGTSSIEIMLTGTLNGTLIVKSDNADYTLVLDNVTIQAGTLPAIQLKSTTTATFYAPEKSYNLISDSSDNTKKGVITSSGSIIFNGDEDSLIEIDVYKKHGIKADGGVTVNGGYLYIHGDENAEGNMISADLFFVMNGGTLDILAEGNVHATESKGIKVNGVEGAGAGLGYVEINGGETYITSVGKAITAGWKQSEDATTEATDDDPIPNVTINDGFIHITTTGTPYEYSDDESLSPEGIEAKNILQINGGEIYLYTTDDSLNAGNAVIINGGLVYAIATENDSIDSNGTIEINGGTVVTMSTSREQAFDCDNDTKFTYTNGYFIGAGNGNNMPNSSNTTGYSIGYGERTFYAGDQIALLDSDKNVVIGFVVPYEVESLTSIVFGSPDFREGETYTLAIGAFEYQPEDGFVGYGQTFRTREEIASFTMTQHTVSEGYIGMNIGGNGIFGGMNGQMPQGNFGGQRPNGTFNGERQDRGFNPNSMFSAFLAQAADVELPEGITLPEDLSSEDAIQLMLYLMGNKINATELEALIQGSIDNGEFETFPGGMPNGMTPPDGQFNPGGMGGTPPQGGMPRN